MKILAVDTSSVAATAAILDDGFVVGEYILNTKLNHSQTIMEMIKSLFNEGSISIGDIDVFACAVGPGSFTGLRIGISVVKGMADALKKPCVSVSTLEGLAFNLSEYDGYICPVMDARCNQVYTALFSGNSGERLWEDDAITIDTLGEKLADFTDKPIILVGDGAQLCYSKLNDSLENLKISKSHNMYSRASSIGLLGEKLYNEDKYCTSGELVPLYLRLPQAQRELKKKQEG